jgi:hypothetical protein
MKAVLLDEQIIKIFVVNNDINDSSQDLFVTWNKNNHTENRPDEPYYVPEFVVEDNNEVILEQGCHDWLEAVAAAKAWDTEFVPVENN